MSTTESDKVRSAVQICLTVTFVSAGFAAVRFGVGDPSTARPAAGWLGAVLGYWLR